MDTIPIEIIHMIYSYLFFPIDIIGFMLTCREYSYLPLDTRYHLGVWKHRCHLHVDVRQIKQFIFTILTQFMEQSLRVTNKLTYYKLTHYNQKLQCMVKNSYRASYLHIITDKQGVMIDSHSIHTYDRTSITGTGSSRLITNLHEETRDKILNLMEKRNITNNMSNEFLRI